MIILKLQFNKKKNTEGEPLIVAGAPEQGFEVWSDGTKTSDSVLILKFDEKFRILYYKLPLDRIILWDGHPCRKTQSATFSSSFSKPSGLNDGYSGNPYLGCMDMLYKGQDGDDAVRRSLCAIEEQYEQGGVLLKTNATYTKGTKKVNVPIIYVWKHNRFGADWSAMSKVQGSQSSQGSTPIYHVVKVDLSKDTIDKGKFTQPTSRMAELCLKDDAGAWLKFAHNLTEKDWNDKEKLKQKYGTVFLTLTIPPIRKEINEFLKERYKQWSNAKLQTQQTWTSDDKHKFLKSIADGILNIFFFTFLFGLFFFQFKICVLALKFKI